MQIIPSWFDKLAENPKSIQKKFPRNLDNRISDLVRMFGYLNHEHMDFLSKSDKNRFLYQLKRMKLIKNICLQDLLNNKRFNYEEIKNHKLFPNISAFSPITTKESVIGALNVYCLARPMPFQEAIALSCYSILEAINPYNERFLNCITSLFNWALSNNDYKWNTNGIPSLETQSLMIKHAALIESGTSKSYGMLFHEWALRGSDTNYALAWEQDFNSFYYLLRKEMPEGPFDKKSNSYHDFLINKTIKLLFNKPEALLPPLDKEYKKLISEHLKACEKSRLSAVYYLDQLRNIKNENFFKEGKELLQRFSGLISDEVYHLMHTSLHYLRYLKISKVLDSEKLFLFKSIYSLTTKERCVLEKELNPQPLAIDADFIQFKQNHPFSNKTWGEILLLTPALQLDLVKKLEAFLETTLPLETSKNLLIFQPANDAIFNGIKTYEECRTEIIQKNHFLMLPEHLATKLLDLGKEFLSFFDMKALTSYHQLLPQIFELAGALQFATYPKWDINLKELFPIDNNSYNDVFRPLTYYFTPFSWVTRWFFNEERNEYHLEVRICNLAKKMRTVSFQVPLKGPLSQEFLRVLTSAVDGLGKEKIEENEECEILNKGKKIIPIPKEEIEKERSLIDQWDVYQSFSPLVMETKDYVDKEQLFQFVSTLRTNLNRSIFALMKSEYTYLASQLETLSFYENQIILGHNQTQRPFVLNKKSYFPWFEKIFLDLYREEIHSHEIIMPKEILFQWVIKPEIIPFEISFAKKQETVRIDLVIPGCCNLVIQYPHFKDKNTFCEYLFWHTALVINDYQKMEIKEIKAPRKDFKEITLDHIQTRIQIDEDEIFKDLGIVDSSDDEEREIHKKFQILDI